MLSFDSLREQLAVPRAEGRQLARLIAVAAAAGATFVLVSLASVLGWLLPLDELVLRQIVPLRSCAGLMLSHFATRLTAIETVALCTVVLALVVGVAGAGLRAVWLAAWTLTLPLELFLKVRVSHPLPANVLGIDSVPCDYMAAAPAWSPGWVAGVINAPVINVEGAIVQPVFNAALGHTFPSGSVLRLAFATALAALWLWYHLRPRYRWLPLTALAAVTTVCAIGPLVLVWHWPSDVVGGALLGVMLAAIAVSGWRLTPYVLRAAERSILPRRLPPRLLSALGGGPSAPAPPNEQPMGRQAAAGEPAARVGQRPAPGGDSRGSI